MLTRDDLRAIAVGEDLERLEDAWFVLDINEYTEGMSTYEVAGLVQVVASGIERMELVGDLGIPEANQAAWKVYEDLRAKRSRLQSVIDRRRS